MVPNNLSWPRATTHDWFASLRSKFGGKQAASPSEGRGFDIPSLDGIRAVAFFVVFMAHTGLGNVIPGGFGVTVFFFLSGFLITTLLRMEAEKTSTVSLSQFYLRRILRILPAFYIVLVSGILLTELKVLQGDLVLSAILSQFGHLTNYRIIAHGYDGMTLGTGLYWSLAVEEHFYLLFPVFYIGLRHFLKSPRSQALVLLAVCAAVLAWRFVLVYSLHSSFDRTDLATDTRVDSILFGCVLALFMNPALDHYSDKARSVWRWLAFPLGLALLIVTFSLRDVHFRETIRYSLQGIALYPVFICAILHPEWLPFRLLNLRFVKFIGVLSYSLYLVHHVVIFGVSQTFGTGLVVTAIISFAISFMIAWVIYLFVEKPCALLRRRISQRYLGRLKTVADAPVTAAT